jgi:tetrahydromethanopterin S-methyltransferase subunit A
MTEDVKGSARGYEDPWPPVRGDYHVGDPLSAVAVVTLTSPMILRGSAIFGQCKTENLGIEKIVANVISNCNIRFVIVCGLESKGHLPGDTLLALHKNGIDDQGRIIGSKGAIPFIQNLTPEAICRFQDQVEVIDCIGVVDAEEIERIIDCCSRQSAPYPGQPFQVVKRRSGPAHIYAGDADMTFGAGVVMDASAWLVMEVTEGG